MKPVGVIGTTLSLFLFFGIAAPAYAQHEQQGEKQGKSEKQDRDKSQAKPERQQGKQQQGKQQQAKPEHQQQQNQDRQQHAQQQQQNQNRQQHAQVQQRDQGRQQQQHARQQQRATPAHQSQQRSAWQQYRAHNSWQSEHRTWQQRGGYNGYRIPDGDFRSHYGRDHGFRIYSLPFMVVGGYPRFQYGGYWFSLVDPWPEFWGENWYETDDVYVDYDNDGYYMYNRRHPGPGIAITISF
jgi:hypothetical protein